MSKKSKNKNKEAAAPGLVLELVMIVKNAGDILRKCLQTNRQYIDRWTILDTGSTDNTPDIIREELKDVPGQLHFSEFTNFSEARNKAFDLASGTCKYMIVLDDSYELANGKVLREFLQTCSSDVVHIKIGYEKGNKQLSDLYYSQRITKASSGIRYKYRVHEALDFKPKTTYEYQDEKNFFIIDHSSQQHRERTFARFKRDISWLLLDREDFPNDPRPLYYLSSTSFKLGKEKDGLKYAKQLLDSTNIKEYTFYAEYQMILYNYTETNAVDVYRRKLMDLQQRFLDRAEPSYKLAVSFYEEGKFEPINKIIDNLVRVPTPPLMLTNLEHEVYDYGIPYLYVEVKLKVKKVDQAVPVLKKMLEKYPNDQKLLNMKYAICDGLNKSSLRIAPKVMVIHTGVIPWVWDPRPNASTKISGSEYMAIYLAKEFRDQGYRVFVFGFFEDIPNKIDYQTTIEGIQYIDTTFFSDFCLSYIVDNLVVSRYIDNLVYYDNIKKVYLWLHDIVPMGDYRFLQVHQQKFKGVICISEWQKQYVCKHTKISPDSVYVSRNAIHPKRFLSSPDPVRIPFRFIFTSDPTRGAHNWVQMIPWIKERYPQSTFYLFGKLEQLTDECLATVKQLQNTYVDAIVLSPRVSQEQLVQELKKSDVWLYPTCFEETYCISAVEAMASGCLVASLRLAALCEVVGDRGVMVDLVENVDKEVLEQETNQALFKALCEVLDDPVKKEEITERGYQWALKQDFYSLACEWKKDLL